LRTRFIAIFLVLVGCSLAAQVYGDQKANEGGDEADTSTKTIFFYYGDNGPLKSISSSVSYSVYLTKALNFNASTNLANSYNKDTDFPSKNVSFNTSISYVPPGSRLSSDIEYSYSETDISIAPSETSEGYKTYNRDVGLTASLTYRFTDNIRSSMDMMFSNNKADKYAPRENRESSEKEDKSVGTTLTYNITPTTNMNVSYDHTRTVGWELARSENFEMFDPPIIKENSGAGDIQSGLQSSLDVSERLHVSTSISVSQKEKVDKYEPAYNSTYLSGNASVSVSYIPHNNFKFFADSSYYRSKSIKDKSMEQLTGEEEFNLLDTNFKLSGNLEWQISKNTRLTTEVGRTYTDNYYYDEEGNHPDQYHKYARYFKETYEIFTRSFLTYNISERLTLQMTHYYNNTDTQFRVLVGENDESGKSKNNNFSSSIYYEFSDSTTALVTAGMDNTYSYFYDEDYAYSSNKKTDKVYLETKFLQDIGDFIQWEVSYKINQNREWYLEKHKFGNNALTRTLGTNISFLWGMVQPSLGGGVSWIRDGANDNKTYTLSPGVSVEPTDKFLVNFYFNYSRTDKTNLENPDYRLTENNIYYNSSISYQLFEGLSLSLSMNKGANQTYSTFSGGINYSF